MNIYDEVTGELLTNPDMTKGYLYPQKRFVAHHDEVKENYTYEIMPGTEELNGGEGLRGKVIITPYQPAYDEYEDCMFYHSFVTKTGYESDEPPTPSQDMSAYPTWEELANQYKKGVSSV